MEKITPDRSKIAKKDSKGIDYSVGNRLARRIKATGRPKNRSKHKLRNDFPLGDKLPKKLWKKKKSKFALARLREEGKYNVAQLY